MAITPLQPWEGGRTFLCALSQHNRALNAVESILDIHLKTHPVTLGVHPGIRLYGHANVFGCPWNTDPTLARCQGACFPFGAVSSEENLANHPP